MKDKCVLTEYTISSGLPRRLVLGLVSDLHESDPKDVLEILRKISPDLILVAGDTFERHGGTKDTQRGSDEGSVERMLRHLLMKLDDIFEVVFGKRDFNPEYSRRFLMEAGKIAPVFLSPGNHEWYFLPKDLDIMKESGTKLLDNRDCKVYIKDMTIRIGGLSSVPDIRWLNGFCAKDGYKILLCHHPEYYDRYLTGKNVNLVLFGHAHGGQIRIGNQGIYAPGQGLFPKYTKGIYNGNLVVTTGCSNTASVPRWGNPREVVRVELK